MSAITISTGTTTRLRLTTRGRRVLASLAALPAVVALSAAMISGGSALATRADGGPAASFDTVTVQSGDSLWAIAERVAPSADPRDVVAAFSRLNGLDAGVVAAGQELAIPAEYSD
ncbi:LysM peptidoglycan-binding domain-containing protein [Microbacterium invictum]|uniref:LysM peptidoglycan-binding domain-containing protein n=1 Tax=Microbacterium invictum TaxID=515415 RepID=A0ABZ0V7R6_9MICO|nr:LysM peptidoglycan-binding domain-containing protein [Microbacterium invictum]WQB69279.1 LysM peptidoglycan-binding domain-containing protein [Microbacterium invictum]